MSGGYRWWYVDALSDDGDYGLTLILFIGSVFSPYYAAARRFGNPDPRNFVSVNVALYGRSHQRWTMTERGRGSLTTTKSLLSIGPSSAEWKNGRLEISIDEVSVPVPRRVKGRITIDAPFVTHGSYKLDPNEKHRWWPICPVADVSVEMSSPTLSWRGKGYLDSNEGDEPVEAGFRHWTWSRAHLEDGTAALLYDPVYPDGSQRSMAYHVDRLGRVSPFVPPEKARLKRSLWGISRETRSETGKKPRIVKTFEDTPFYARSSIETTLLGQTVPAIHESLSIPRLTSPMVRLMLPVRMPRRTF